MTQHRELFAALAAPFESHELKIRSQQGRQLTYITARTVMNRLDNVLGPENWWDEYVPSENSVLCRLTIRLPDGSVLTKCDAGGYAGMADSGDDDKSGYSDAFKRAAVKFGVARYLYRDGAPTYTLERTGTTETPAPATATSTPALAADSGAGSSTAPARSAATTNGATPRTTAATAVVTGNSNPPRTGKALFAWTKEQEQRYEVGLLKYLNGWAKLQEFPARMVEWDADQVGQGYAEACRKLQALQQSNSEAREEALAN
jgi:hypothetical protein